MKFKDDGWWGTDKACHGWLHFGIVVGVCWILKYPLHLAVIMSLAWGVLYEGWDEFRNVGFSYKDIVWNCIGMVAGALVMFIGGWR